MAKPGKKDKDSPKGGKQQQGADDTDKLQELEKVSSFSFICLLILHICIIILIPIDPFSTRDHTRAFHLQAMTQIKDKLKTICERLETKLINLRAGGADPTILEIISVETGGSRVPLKALGTVAVPSPREMLVHVHDVTILADIEVAIMNSGLNLMPQADKAKSTIRVPIPKTTKEQREARVKLASEIAEGSKGELRRVRQDVHKSLKSLGLPEDDLDRAEKQLQKFVDAGNEKLAGMFKKKEKELLTG